MAPSERYRSLYELGRGGMGAVELAEDTQDGGRLVAIKRILPDLAREPKTRAMFLKEARLLARLDHPNLVHALEVDPGDADAPPVLVMEYVNGVSLRDLLVESPEGVPFGVATRIAHDIALGLHAAHELRDASGRELGVVHRDVTPHNVLVTFDGRVKLLDFGVAKVNEGTRTQTGEVRGKIAYMAPEQAMAESVDRRSDLYALGALLYELLSGQRMHGGGTELEIMRRMATSVPKPVGELRDGVPPELAELVGLLTAEDRGKRPATAREVCDALAPFAAATDEAALASWVGEVLPEAPRSHRARISSARAVTEVTVAARPRRTLWSLWAALAVLALGGGAVVLARAPRFEAPAPSRAAFTPSASHVEPASPPPPGDPPPLPPSASGRSLPPPVSRVRATPTVAPPPPATQASVSPVPPRPPVPSPPVPPKIDPAPF